MIGRRNKVQRGFTLIELLTVCAIIGVLASLVLPAISGPRIKAVSTRCLNNLKQMALGWNMYANDFDDILLPNTPTNAALSALNKIGNGLSWCGTAQEGWGSQDANTNTIYYLNSPLSPYLAGNLEVYKCPGDTMPSANGQRLRSYSMNCQMGQYYSSQLGPNIAVNNNPGYRVYNTMKDLTCPDPGMAWVFCDEHAGSIDDGFLRVNMTAGIWPDVPGSYHNWSCSFAFADGHAEVHNWLTPQIQIPVQPGKSVHNLEASPSNPDYVWFIQRTSCPVGNF